MKNQNEVYVSLGTRNRNNLSKDLLLASIAELKGFKFELSESLSSSSSKYISAYNQGNQIKYLTVSSLFITHCGMNSMVESILCLTPMLCFPESVEQKINAQRIEKLGLGVILDESKIHDKAYIEEAIYKSMADKAAIEKIKIVRASILNGGGAARAAHEILTYAKSQNRLRDNLLN